jgi:hypothetical protein
MATDRMLRRPSASTAAFDRQDIERLRRMTVLERMQLSLELGRRGRAIQKLVKPARRVDAGR